MKVVAYGLATSLLMSAVLVSAAPAQKDPVESKSATADSASSEAGMRAYVDPEGNLQSQPVTDEQRAAAAQPSPEFSQDESRMVDAVASDGSPMRILNGQHEMAMAVAIGADGKQHVVCTDDAHAALAPHSHVDVFAAPARDEK